MEIKNEKSSEVSFSAEDNKRLRALIERYPNWKNILLKRHHKFTLAYLASGGSVEAVARKFQYRISEMQMIFKKIGKSLESFDQTQVQQSKDKEEDFKGLNDRTKERIEEVLSQCEGKNLQLIFPERLALCIESILETRNLEETAKMMNVGKTYLISRLIGRNHPRKPSEKGALYYLGLYAEKEKVNKKSKQRSKQKV